MFMLPLFALLGHTAEPTPFLLPFPPPEISSFWGLQLPSSPLGLKRYFRPPWEEAFDWVFSSDLLSLNTREIATLLHRSSGRRFFSDISFAPSSLALSCFWEILQDLSSDHLPILLTVPLSPVFRLNDPSFNFQKTRWGDFAFYFDSYCRAKKYSSLSFAAALFTSLALNAAKSSILFGCIKRHSKALWSAEVEEAISERRKAFAAAHRSDEDRQAYIFTS